MSNKQPHAAEKYMCEKEQTHLRAFLKRFPRFKVIGLAWSGIRKMIVHNRMTVWAIERGMYEEYCRLRVEKGFVAPKTNKWEWREIQERKEQVKREAEERKMFYESRLWRELRYEAFRRHGNQCQLCKRSDVVLHVDHIKPRSKYPRLELSIDNLQILCVDCNLGKSNKDETDWRQTETSEDWFRDERKWK